MTARGFAAEAAARMPIGGHGRLPVWRVEPAIDALERGIARRSRRIISPSWVGPVLAMRPLAQRIVERRAGGLDEALELARRERERVSLTPQP
jgi:hypothetical protein